LYDQELSFYSFRQETLSNPQWYERFNTKVDVGDAIGVTRQNKVLLEYVAQETLTSAFADLGFMEQRVVRDDAEERYVSYAFLEQSGNQHGNLNVDLQNDFTTGDNRYPKNHQKTLHLLDKYSKTAVAKVTQSEGTSFAQRSGRGGGRGGRSGNGKSHDNFDKEYWKDKTCYKCEKKGKPANKCPKKSNNDDDKKSVASAASSVKKLNKDFKSMKKAFTKVNTQLKKLNEAVSDLSGSEDDDDQSHFQMDAAIQFAQVDKEFEPTIANLFKQAGSSVKIDLREVILLDSQSTIDLFCNAALVSKTRKSTTSMRLKSNGGTMVVTRKSAIPGYNKDVWFSKRAITDIIALSNLILQYRVTYDSDDKMFVVHRESQGKPNMGFKWVIRSNQIKYCPVTVQYIDVALKIWGKNIAALKGKTTRCKTIPVARDYVKVSLELMKLHKEVFLMTDIFFVNKNPFFLTLSRNIMFTAVNHLAGHMVPHIFKAFKEIYQYYLQRDFHITVVHAHGEFAPLKPLVESIPGGPVVNLASANEHVPEIERRIRVVKEHCWATRHSLPFERISKIMTIHIVLNVVKLLIFFPTKGGVSETLSPKTIMLGETLEYKKHLSLQIGHYCQVHEEDHPRNSQLTCTKGAISLGPSGNLQGGFKFMALNNGKKIARRSWDVIPISDVVIARVNAWGSDQPLQMTFKDRYGRLIGDIDIPGVDSDEKQEDHLPGVAPVIDDDIDIPGVDVAGPEALDEAPAPQVEINDLDIPQDDPAPIEVAPPQESAAPAMPTPVVTPSYAEGLPRSNRVRTQVKQAYTLSMTGSNYSYAVTQLETQGVLNPDAHMFVQEDFYQAEPDVVAAIMTQLSLKPSLKEWGDQAFTAARSEMKQLHLWNTFKPNHVRELSQVQRQTVLESHMFLKQKRDGKIKGRTVAGGNKQRDYISNEDASSPTVATEALLLSCIIDAEEGRDVAVVDIPFVCTYAC
jgi:hypothetical protein